MMIIIALSLFSGIYAIAFSPCIDPSHTAMPTPANYSNHCISSGTLGICDSEGVCYDGDACTSDICGYSNCSGNLNNHPVILHCGCMFLPIAGCCNFDIECNDDNPCTSDTCSLDSHQCIHAPKTCLHPNTEEEEEEETTTAAPFMTTTMIGGAGGVGMLVFTCCLIAICITCCFVKSKAKKKKKQQDVERAKKTDVEPVKKTKK